MNIKFLLFISAAAIFTGCSSAYKTGQTPDDVYYSPAKEQSSYVKVEKEKDKYTEDNMRYQAYDDYVNDYRNDRFLRLSLSNRMYLNMYNDYYWNDWRYGNSVSWYNPWNSYYSWNSFYNPYCYNTGYTVKNGNYNTNNYRPNINVNSYTNKTYSKTNPRYNFKSSNYNNSNYSNSNTRVYRSSNNSTFGKIVSALSSGSSNYNNSNNSSSSSDRSTRTYTPSSSSSSGGSSGGSSGSSGGSVSRPTRGGGN